MVGLSNGMLLERMKEEYGSMLSTANSSVASSASSFQRIEAENLSSSLIQQFYKVYSCKRLTYLWNKENIVTRRNI